VKHRKQSRPSIAPASLAEGYSLSVDNGLRLLASALELNETFLDKALALAQVGQEEIGKSLTVLAAFALRDDSPAWEGFWDVLFPPVKHEEVLRSRAVRKVQFQGHVCHARRSPRPAARRS
jgi:hypothetical protein